VIQRGFRYRLYPTAEQAELLSQFVGVTRFVYNLCLEQRRDWWRRGRCFNLATQSREVTLLRAEVDWIAAVPYTPLSQAIRDLDRAYSNFFSGRANYPSPRRRGVNDGCRFKAVDVRTAPLTRRWSLVRIPKIGMIRYRDTRPLQGKIINVTVSKGAIGWFVTFACEIEHEAAPSTLPAVGIDRGVANTLALSTGELLSTPCTTRLERRKKRAQRILARRKRGSNRYRKQRRRVAGIAAKIARVRKEWQHRASTDIARRFGVVALEDLKTSSMVKANRGLARSIHEQGWGGFELKLAYKLEERGGVLEKVNPAYTSQTCSACGTIDKASRESQASFACRHCGFTAHADTNAAINILRRSTAFMRVEDAGCGSAETRTDHALAA
jgi:putative transposase